MSNRMVYLNVMDICKSCEIWSIPRGFQRPSDYTATYEKLAGALKRSELILVSEYNFENSFPSPVRWPSVSVNCTFQCSQCEQQFVLSVDIDECRGGLRPVGT